MSDVSLAEQLRCAKRELRMRTEHYPRWVREEQMTESAAKRELRAMTAIVNTLAALVDAEQRRQQPDLFAPALNGKAAPAPAIPREG